MEQYTVSGMSCAACSARVEKAVQGVPGVTDCSVSLLTHSMGVEGTADPAAGPVPQAAKAADEELPVDDHHRPGQKQLQKPDGHGVIPKERRQGPAPHGVPHGHIH